MARKICDPYGVNKIRPREDPTPKKHRC